MGVCLLSSIHRSEKTCDTVRGGPLNQLWGIGEYPVRRQGYCADEAGEDAFPLFVLASEAISWRRMLKRVGHKRRRDLMDPEDLPLIFGRAQA